MYEKQESEITRCKMTVVENLQLCADAPRTSPLIKTPSKRDVNFSLYNFRQQRTRKVRMNFITVLLFSFLPSGCRLRTDDRREAMAGDGSSRVTLEFTPPRKVMLRRGEVTAKIINEKNVIQFFLQNDSSIFYALFSIFCHFTWPVQITSAI